VVEFRLGAGKAIPAWAMCSRANTLVSAGFEENAHPEVVDPAQTRRGEGLRVGSGTSRTGGDLERRRGFRDSVLTRICGGIVRSVISRTADVPGRVVGAINLQHRRPTSTKQRGSG